MHTLFLYLYHTSSKEIINSLGLFFSVTKSKHFPVSIKLFENWKERRGAWITNNQQS